MFQRFAIGLLLLVGLIALLAGWGFYRNARMSKRFEEVTLGASDAQVRYLLGRPSWIESCGKSFGTAKPNCTEYLYRNSFAPVIPEYYYVRLDVTGHVIEKDVYESP